MESMKGNTADAQTFDRVLTKQHRIAQLARLGPQTSFTALAHHIDLDWLRVAYDQVRKDAAPGVDQEDGGLVFN